MKLYVGNLPYSVNDAELRQIFEPHGAVMSATVIIDRDTGRSRGFGFVEMASNEEGNKAIEAVNGKDMGGRALVVNEAKPREERPRGGGGWGGGGGRGGYGGAGRGDRGDRGDRGGRGGGGRW